VDAGCAQHRLDVFNGWIMEYIAQMNASGRLGFFDVYWISCMTATTVACLALFPDSLDGRLFCWFPRIG
jgi:hypothetical protein